MYIYICIYVYMYICKYIYVHIYMYITLCSRIGATESRIVFTLEWRKYTLEKPLSCLECDCGPNSYYNEVSYM